MEDYLIDIMPNLGQYLLRNNSESGFSRVRVGLDGKRRQKMDECIDTSLICTGVRII